MLDANISKKVQKSYDDTLSNLPAPILNHILSFLSTEEVVRTCVLSSKWKYMWTVVTNLHFDDCLPYSRSRKNNKANFMHSVERVLLLGSPVIDKFYLTSLERYDVSRVHSWISAAIRRNVRKLIISPRCTKPLVFPRCLYDNDSLVEMEIQMYCIFNVPTSICFSRLKILQLSGVTLSNECSSKSSELHFGFPLLEVLIFRCLWKKVNVVNIDAPKLNNFTFSYKEKMSNFAVKIHGSSLEKFECRGNSFVDFILPSNISVIHAAIEISDIKEQELKTGLLICRLLRQFSNLEYLTLSSQTVAALTYVKDLQDHLPMVNKVNHLTIQGISWNPHLIGGTFIALLQSLPVLESLIFDEGISWFKNDEMLREVPPCFQTRLKVVRFQYFDSANGLELAKLFLKNALVLEEMTITAGGRFRYPLESEFEAIKEQVVAFPRGSHHASISFGK